MPRVGDGRLLVAGWLQGLARGLCPLSRPLRTIARSLTPVYLLRVGPGRKSGDALMPPASVWCRDPHPPSPFGAWPIGLNSTHLPYSHAAPRRQNALSGWTAPSMSTPASNLTQQQKLARGPCCTSTTHQLQVQPVHQHRTAAVGIRRHCPPPQSLFQGASDDP